MVVWVKGKLDIGNLKAQVQLTQNMGGFWLPIGWPCGQNNRTERPRPACVTAKGFLLPEVQKLHGTPTRTRRNLGTESME